MFGIGAQELAIICVVALLVFGPKRLPELARTLGRGMAEFRRASTDLRRSIELEAEPETPPVPPKPNPAADRVAQSESEAATTDPSAVHGAPAEAVPTESTSADAAPVAEPTHVAGDESSKSKDSSGE